MSCIRFPNATYITFSLLPTEPEESFALDLSLFSSRRLISFLTSAGFMPTTYRTRLLMSKEQLSTTRKKNETKTKQKRQKHKGLGFCGNTIYWFRYIRRNSDKNCIMAKVGHTSFFGQVSHWIEPLSFRPAQDAKQCEISSFLENVI